ncbi:tRNA-specific 2-thiouridylase MnmA [uncultured Gammaproteobacteria bacterium]
MTKPRIVVAMSGGVDSSVTAALLQQQGWEVIGVTLQLYDHGQAIGRKGACCAGQDIYDARRIADQLGIVHYVLDYEARFHQAVIDDFADSYLRGETPIPCVRCNQEIKFGDLLETARGLGAQALATGHYARRVEGACGVELWRGADHARDQSYFLFATTRAQLAFLRFPLADLTKAETRALARALELPVASKPDSQDICFVPDGNYAAVVARLRPLAAATEPGDIVNIEGETIGHHQGVVHYTIGQRRGLGIGGRRGAPEQPLYVAALDPQRRQVVVGPRTALARTRVTVHSVNWLDPDPPPAEGIAAQVRLRSTQPPAAARVWLEVRTGIAQVALEAPQYGVAPGQACVVYCGERVVGGGWIAGAT